MVLTRKVNSLKASQIAEQIMDWFLDDGNLGV